MITIGKHSGIYTLKVHQKLPISINEAWEFFSEPGNLTKITPPHMGFKITSELTDQIYTGQIITYRVKPIPYLIVNWVTEITTCISNRYFIDEQRFGPYKMWHHEHHFDEIDSGVKMTDIVSYKLPFGIFGQLAHWLFVKRQLINIFEYRTKVLKETFKNQGNVQHIQTENKSRKASAEI